MKKMLIGFAILGAILMLLPAMNVEAGSDSVYEGTVYGDYQGEGKVVLANENLNAKFTIHHTIYYIVDPEIGGYASVHTETWNVHAWRVDNEWQYIKTAPFRGYWEGWAQRTGDSQVMKAEITGYGSVLEVNIVWPDWMTENGIIPRTPLCRHFYFEATPENILTA